MTAAVSSSTVATATAGLVASAAASAGPDADAPARDDPAAATSAAPPLASKATLSSDTVAALVAQQADPGSAAAAPSDAAAPAPSATADVFAGASDLVQQVQHYASLMVDGSGASDADKAGAFAQLYQLRFKVGGSATDPSSDDWFTQSNAAQRQAVQAEIEGSSFFKQAMDAASRFNATGIALARAGDTSDANSEAVRFSQLSSAQQTLIWAGGFSQFQSLDDVKSYLAQQAAVQAADNASASSAAKTAATPAPDASASADTADPVTQAAKSLLASGAGASMADVALSVLKSGAAARAKVEGDDGQGDDWAAAGATPDTTAGGKGDMIPIPSSLHASAG